MHFLELVKKNEDERSDLSGFLTYFEAIEGEDLYVNLSDADAVRILTVHKSKGLEFPVVVLPFLGMDVQVGSGGSDYQQSYILRQGIDSVGLMRLKSKYLLYSDKLYNIYAEEYRKNFLSELNNIYVALTRAGDELYAMIPPKVGNSRNLIQDLIPKECYQMGESSPKAMEDVRQRPVTMLSPARHQNWIESLREEFIPFEDMHHRARRRDGEIIHFMLSFIQRRSGSIEQSMDHVKKMTLAARPELQDMDAYLKDLKRILNAEDFKPFFETTDEVKTELEVVNRFGDIRRVDRLHIKKDEIWIIDYKSGEDPEGRQFHQIQEYRELFQSLYPGRQVKGFIFYLDQLRVEDVE